jgi:hypothetical protein
MEKTLDTKKPIEALEILFAASCNFTNFPNISVRESQNMLTECMETIKTALLPEEKQEEGESKFQKKLDEMAEKKSKQ